MLPGENAEDVHMICNATDDDYWTIHRFECPANVGVHLLTNGTICKEGIAILGREDNVDEDASERLSHDTLLSG